MIDLLPQHDTTSVRTLRSYCVGNPTPDKLDAICRGYRDDPQQHLFGIEEHEQVIGCTGIRCEAPSCAVVQCIAVLPEQRQQHVGISLIQSVCNRFALQQLIAETDQDAVDFYRRYGFTVTSLGEVYPGTERFLCVLQC
ncbi:MAG: GNAT family N-acetyltransferase [Chloroflexi bacterium AL-W]|nr:GNAT family N-acetyltransferase [Chloroflexi bacterium AL-N1]NOK67564.1 GNAT family N-acetyltransferase [Chloroflexi bacterium AL-N10]NOK75666.1 GNAT family N-acetyltransferase [Chloroflexi bacterium AL-N5]NOK82454.1 GNAT family N-acetyltransferase [Chloroflexi bacterium AL-W]NOK90299.1 GNAT family N-acetyltransferase [Chloroflexi bacterium AL-N15]